MNHAKPASASGPQQRTRWRPPAEEGQVHAHEPDQPQEDRQEALPIQRLQLAGGHREDWPHQLEWAASPEVAATDSMPIGGHKARTASQAAASMDSIAQLARSMEKVLADMTNQMK